jgi:DNA-binding protein HU-beta
MLARGPVLNKNDLVSAVAGQTEMPKAQVLSTIDAAIRIISTALRKGDDVRLVGFGTFYVARRKACKGRDPRTGETIAIKAGKLPKFKAGKVFKDSLG